MRLKIRWRLAIPFVLLIIVVMGGLSIYITALVRDAQLDGLQTSLLVQAQAVAESARLEFDSGGPEALDELSRKWAGLLGARVTIIAADGVVLGESDEDRGQMDNHLNRPEVQRALASGEGSSIRHSQTIGSDMMYAAVTIEMGGEVIGYSRVALPLGRVESTVNQLRGAILSAALIAVLAATIIAVLIAGRVSRSLQHLTEAARRMAAGDLDARIYRTADGELGELTLAFNHMADQLRERVNDLAGERSRLAAVLENMADGVLITNSIGQVILMNPGAARLLEVKEKESVGRSFAEVARHHELIELWQSSCSQGEEQVTTIELGRKGAFVQVIVTPLSTADHDACLVILQDLTRIRQLETVRRDFISNISHELRTPLASLKALVETLRDGALEDPPAARRFLNHADQELDALTQMVRELLELSRIESGMVPLRLQPTPVEDVILPPLERLRPQAERQKLDLSVDIPAGLPLILSDAERIQQVVGNLVHNAIKFTPEEGRIQVSAGLDKTGTYIVIEVKDTGVGIPAMELDRIFERFYKADRARSGGGTGLGLAISRHLVQAHDGQIWVKSKEGKGSTFYFSLPVTEATSGNP